MIAQVTEASAATQEVALLPGDVRCSADPVIFVTILGSCVAVCLWDRVRAIGGMNHFVLWSDRQQRMSTRYGEVSMEALQDGMMGLGSRLEHLQAKVFGGAAVLPFGNEPTVGTVNASMALQVLEQLRIPVLARRIGGGAGRQLRFHTGTGQVLIRSIATSTPL